MTQPPPLPPSGPPPVPRPQGVVGRPQPTPANAADRAQRQVTEQTRTYPCGNCGAPLAYAPDQQRLACASCGTTYPIELDPNARIVKHDLQTAMNQLAGNRALGLASIGGNEHVVTCQACGGKTIFNGSLTATRCPYCATPIQRDDIQDAPERLALDAVLPLQVAQPQAQAAIEKWINSRWFAPSEFKKYRTLGSFTSVYMSYYSYDVEATTGYSGQRGDDYTVVVGSGDDQHTETRTAWRPVSGRVHDSIRDLPEMANTGMDDDRVRELEPWPVQAAVPYTPEFVAGHLSRTYDRDPGDVFDKNARPRVDSQIDGTIRRDIGGDHQQIHHKQTVFDQLAFMYLLLPMWLLTVNFEGRPFQVFVNGLTGEVQGDRPWSKVKIAAAVVAALILIGVLVFLFMRMR